jgi:cell wall-associated NlpC family hydrolase
VSYADPQKKIDEVAKQVEALEHKAEESAELSNELTDKKDASGRRLEKLKADTKRQLQKVAALRSHIGQRAAADYRTGGMDTTVQLLLAKNPDDFLAQMTTAQALAGQQGDALTQLKAEQKRLVERQALEQAELSRFKQAEAGAAAKMKEANDRLAASRAVLKQLNAAERKRLEKQREEREERERRPSRDKDRETPEPKKDPKDPDDDPAPPPPGSGRGAIALAKAKEYLGVPYVFGGESKSGVDCSGLTLKAWEAAGVSLPHSSRQQYAVSTKISRSELQLGDLVFFYGRRSHVGIFAGNGQVIHAPRVGKDVEYINMSYMPVNGYARPG